MMKLCWNAVLVDDQEGCQHAGVLLAHAPCEDGVVDTSSDALTRAIVFHDDCLGQCTPVFCGQTRHTS